MEISQLFIYPVKSLRGIEITESTLTSLGLRFDRHWMIINEKDQFITQRKNPKMVLIHTHIDEKVLRLSKHGMPDIDVPLQTNQNTQEQETLTSTPAETLTATIWNDDCTVTVESVEVNQWITQALDSKQNLRLVRMADNHQRPQSKPERFGDNTTQFADAVSYLLCHESSLNHLNDALLEKQLDPCVMEQFRPNIVIKNEASDELPALNPFQEHHVKKYANSVYGFISCDPCQRCIMPTIDIQTGTKHPQQEPYKTLVQLNPMPDNPKAPAFGQNLTLLSKSEGQKITVGDRILFTV